MDSTRATFQQLNGPYWTLAIEWQFYLLLPLIALGIRCVARRVSPEKRSWAVMGCLLGLMGWGLLTRAVGSYFMAHPTATFLVPRGVLNVVLFFTYGSSGKYLEDFAVGMLAGLVYTLWRDPATGAKVGQILRRLSPWLCAGGIALLLFMAMQHYSLTYQYTWPVAPGLFQLPGWLHELGFALGFGAGMLAILFGPVWLRGTFAWLPLRWIGLISYSLYIWHLPMLGTFFHHIGPSLHTLPALVTYGLYWVWAIVIVIPFSFVLYVLIEKPGMRLSERLRGKVAMQRQPEPITKRLVEVS
jgi:peptidoglycan/LPS O-acetylase OafA/YrhL